MVLEELRPLKAQIFGPELACIIGLPMRFAHGFTNQWQDIIKLFKFWYVGDDESKGSLWSSLALIEEDHVLEPECIGDRQFLIRVERAAPKNLSIGGGHWFAAEVNEEVVIRRSQLTDNSSV